MPTLCKEINKTNIGLKVLNYLPLTTAGKPWWGDGGGRGGHGPPVIETRRKIGNLVFYRNLCLGLPACNNGNFTC